MSTQIARLTRLEQSARTGSRRIVVVEDQKALEAARAFLQGRPDVDMDRITFVVTGVPRNGRGPEDWLRAARGA
jgi:GTP1/Obg family GTP-binding protein